MPRPISWLPRLHEITRSVANSVRSHYDRRDIEVLFQLQPRAAQKLLELLPSVQVGTSKLIDREVLSAFLGKVRDTEDVSGLLDELRSRPATAQRRKIRSLVRRDVEPASLAALPDALHVVPGRVEVTFETVEQLAETMLMLARILETDGDAFAEAYEPRAPLPEPFAAADVRSMFAELETMEAARRP